MSLRPRPAKTVAFAPGRANLIGEHTDYNDGLALPFAIEQGVTVEFEAARGDELLVVAVDYDDRDRFPLKGPERKRSDDWRDFVRGAIGELSSAGVELQGGNVEITGTVPPGSGLSSSAALAVALCVALSAAAHAPLARDKIALARLCSRIENDWVGARTGLLDQLASLLSEAGHAMRIDFRTLGVRLVPLELGGWRLVTVDSGERRSLATSGYNERRAECERAAELLAVRSLRDATADRLAELPDPLDRRVRHVLEENQRVDACVDALEAGRIGEIGSLLDASHASLRDLYDASTPAVESTVARLKEAGAAGARMMGAGFGGDVIAIFPPAAATPPVARTLTPAAGARLLHLDEG